MGLVNRLQFHGRLLQKIKSWKSGTAPQNLLPLHVQFATLNRFIPPWSWQHHHSITPLFILSFLPSFPSLLPSFHPSLQHLWTCWPQSCIWTPDKPTSIRPSGGSIQVHQLELCMQLMQHANWPACLHVFMGMHFTRVHPYVCMFNVCCLLEQLHL